MFGRKLNPIKDYSDSIEGSEIDLENWKEHMEKIQSLIYPAIIERTRKQKTKMMKYLDKKRRVLLTPYPVGAIVNLRDPNKRDKFEPKYVGPYSIIRRTRNGNYRLRDATGIDLDRAVPPDQLKLISEKAREKDCEDAIYEVEKITDHRGEPGRYEYKVVWKYFDDTTWEPEEHFYDVTMIRNYWREKQLE